MNKSHRSKAFTLIEILLAVAIFTGMVVLVFATLARSAASSQKADELRSKSDTTRKIVDQITNDFNYLFLDKQLQIDQTITPSTPVPVRGFAELSRMDNINWLSSDKEGLILILKMPKDNTLTIKRYYIEDAPSTSPGKRTTLKYMEFRSCTYDETSLKIAPCDPASSTAVDLLPEKFSLAHLSEVDSSTSELLSTYSKFEVNTIDESRSLPLTRNEWQNGSLNVSITIKPSPPQTCDPSAQECSCNQLPAGTCYSLSTTLFPKLVQ